MATKEMGCQASYREMAESMNRQALTIASAPPTKFNTTNVWRWFRQNGGKEKSPLEKPYLTDDQKKERKKWCIEEKQRMEEYGDEFYACFLDEKWFYTVSRRRRVKVLPPGPDEDPEEVWPHLATTRSRRHPIKVCCTFYIFVA